MDQQNGDTSPTGSRPRRFIINSLLLGIVAVVPFGMMILLNWLASVDYFVHPLLVTWMSLAGAVALIMVSQAEIRNTRNSFPGSPYRRQKIMTVSLTLLGLLAAILLLFLGLGYIVTTSLMN